MSNTGAPQPVVNPEWADTHPPDLSGPAGRAWRVDLEAWYAKYPDEPRMTVDAWFMHVPNSHPFWTWYAMLVVHLRPTEGAEPAVKQFEDARYEMLVLSLDPKVACPDPRDPDFPAFLSPPDHVLQWPTLGGDDSDGHQDSRSRELVELFALAVVDGKLVPDSDHRQAWLASMIATVDHFRDGTH